jgi:PAS domain S-box-containing protein
MSLNIRQRLPLFICILLLVIISIFATTSFVGIKHASLNIGEQRLIEGTNQLSSLLVSSVRSIKSNNYSVANWPAVKSFLSTDGKDSATARHLRDLLTVDSNTVATIVLSKDGRLLLSSARNGKAVFFEADSLVRKIINTSHDSTYVGKFYYIKDSVYYPSISPVSNEGAIVGYFLQWRLLNNSRQTLSQISQLLGDDSRLLLGNKDGSLWTDIVSVVSKPEVDTSSATKIYKYKNNENEALLGRMKEVPNSSWIIAVEIPEKKILEPAHKVLTWIILAGLIILAIGIFVAWQMSRKISEPLVQLTSASTAIASGHYPASIVQTDRLDELGKLARAFNAMSTKVQKSQQTLESEAAKYRMLFEKNPMPMWIVSKQTNMIIDVNEAAIRHYGYSREEFLNLKAASLRPDEDLDKYLDYFNNYSTGPTKTGVWKHKRKDGVIILVDVYADDILYKKEPARFVLVNDITERIKSEEEIIRYQVNKQKLITEVTIEAQEKEREEIGKELHDNINQILASVKLHLELAKADPKQFPEAIENSYDHVNLAITEIRQLSKQLVMPSLEDSLVNVIREFIEDIERLTDISFTFLHVDFNEYLLDEKAKVMIYRILQEQVNNILKHADATRVKVVMETKGNSFSLTITDNGRGFDPGIRARGIGLRNIENRVRMYNGTSEVTSEPGDGTTLKIVFPLGEG